MHRREGSHGGDGVPAQATEPAAEHDTGRFFVVTGGPGAGKTTLMEALAARCPGRTDPRSPS